MKPFLAFVAGLLVFSGGGMQGRLGSVLAAFIDPGALVDVTPGTQGICANAPTTCPPGSTLTGVDNNGCPACVPTILPGGITPGQTPPVQGKCPFNYVYSPTLKMCVQQGFPHT